MCTIDSLVRLWCIRGLFLLLLMTISRIKKRRYAINQHETVAIHDLLTVIIKEVEHFFWNPLASQERTKTVFSRTLLVPCCRSNDDNLGSI